jgi:phosphomevalonate kinase
VQPLLFRKYRHYKFSMSRSVVAVSAPGKALFAGGYLVLDRQYTGLVFGLDARIHVHVRRDQSRDPLKNQIVVASPQFNAVWAYKFSTENGRVDVHPE